LLVKAGSTIGGAVAAGTSGPGSYRYGGIRTFILGASFVDGEGRVIKTGGKVVKNAAGFDFPKLMVGSLGGLGILTEVTFKVFPKAAATETTSIQFPTLRDAVSAVAQLGRTPLSVEALEIQALSSGARLMVRISGSRELLGGKVEELEDRLGRGKEGQRLVGETEQQFWIDAREMSWAAAAAFLMRVPVVPSRIMELDGIASSMGLEARYGIGGNVAWLSGTEDTPDLVTRIAGALRGIDLAGVMVRGTSGGPLLGKTNGPAFRQRIKAVLDPRSRFRAY
jgi:glycolate oxidase FAD binding subunit